MNSHLFYRGNQFLSAMTLPAFLLFAFSLPQVATAQRSSVDTSTVSDDSFCVVRVDIQRLIQQVKMGSKDLEQLVETFKEEAGLDVMGMKAMTFQFGPPDKRDNGPSFSVTFEHLKKVELKNFFDKNRFGEDEFTDDEINGKKFKRHRRAGGPHIYQVNERSLTMATEGAIESILKNASTSEKMAGLLKSAPEGSELIAVFNTSEGFSTFSKELLAAMPGDFIPFDLAPIAESVESGFGYLNIKSSQPLTIQLTCNSGEQSLNMKNVVDQSLKMGKLLIPSVRENVETQLADLKEIDEPNRREAGQLAMMEMSLDGLNLASQMINGAQTTSNAKTFSLTVKKMGGISEIVPLAVGGMKMMFFGRSGYDDPLPPAALEKAERRIDR